MKLCINCAYFLDSTKEWDPSIFETYPRVDKCARFYSIEPVRGLRINMSCDIVRADYTKCGPFGKSYAEAM